MSYRELENVDAKYLPVSKLIVLIYNSQKIFLKNMLGELNINNTQLYILFKLPRLIEAVDF